MAGAMVVQKPALTCEFVYVCCGVYCFHCQRGKPRRQPGEYAEVFGPDSPARALMRTAQHNLRSQPLYSWQTCLFRMQRTGAHHAHGRGRVHASHVIDHNRLLHLGRII